MVEAAGHRPELTGGAHRMEYALDLTGVAHDRKGKSVLDPPVGRAQDRTKVSNGSSGIRIRERNGPEQLRCTTRLADPRCAPVGRAQDRTLPSNGSSGIRIRERNAKEPHRCTTQRIGLADPRSSTVGGAQDRARGSNGSSGIRIRERNAEEELRCTTRLADPPRGTRGSGWCDWGNRILPARCHASCEHQRDDNVRDCMQTNGFRFGSRTH